MFRSLQAARAVAALMVLTFHLGPTLKHYFGATLVLVPFGHVGVDFFFVLSGFIIMSAHRGDVGQPVRLGRFLWKRFVRVYPVYWLVFVAAFAGAYRIVALSGTELVNALLLTPTGVAPVISVAWSLQWEVVFYLIFGALIVHPLLALVALAGVAYGLPDAPMYLGLFLAGVAGAVIAHRHPVLPGRSLAVVGSAVFGAACIQDVLSGTKPTAWLGAGAAIAIVGLVCAERAGHVFGKQRWLQVLGDASYSIYLIHYPLISAGCKAATAVGLQGEAWGMALYPVLLALVLLVGVALHLWIERPLIRRLNRRSHEVAVPR